MPSGKRISRSDIFDINFRRFIREGVKDQINEDVLSYEDGRKSKVIQGQKSKKSLDGLFAATWLTGQSSNYPYSYFPQPKNPDGTENLKFVQVVDAWYMIQFYRSCNTCDAMEAAQAFGDWVDSHSGITWASTAITDGRLTGVNVYCEGDISPEQRDIKSNARYEPNEVTGKIAIEPMNGESEKIPSFRHALAEFYISSNSRLESGNMSDEGEGYIETPSFWLGQQEYRNEFDHFLVPEQKQDIGNVIHPWVAFRGRGFTIERPIVIGDISDAVSVPNAEWEPRAAVHLKVQYERFYDDKKSTAVDVKGEIVSKDRIFDLSED